MLNSIAGDYVKSLPQVVILALIASFFFAFLVTPCLAFVFFKAKPHNNKVKAKTVMQQLLEFGLKRKLFAFLAGILVIGILGSKIWI